MTCSTLALHPIIRNPRSIGRQRLLPLILRLPTDIHTVARFGLLALVILLYCISPCKVGMEPRTISSLYYRTSC